MSTQPLKVGIIGSGNAAAKHRAAFAELPDLWQITEATKADVVSICTPPYRHFKQADTALKRDQHAIVEKPLCGSLAECEELSELERISGKRVFPIFQYRFAPAYDPVPPAYYWSRDSAYYAGWRGQWTAALGGVLTSHAIHIFDRLIHKHGMPHVVKATISDWHTIETGVEVNMHVGDDIYRGFFYIFVNNEPGNTLLGDSHAGYVAQFRYIHRAITEGTEPTVTLAQARQSIELLTACYKSAYLGEPVTLPILPDDPWYDGWSNKMREHYECEKVKIRRREQWAHL